MSATYRHVMTAHNYKLFYHRDLYTKTQEFHSHDFYELYFFLDGNVTYYIEDTICRLMYGDVLVIPPGKMHRPVVENINISYERYVLWNNVRFLHTLSEPPGRLLAQFTSLEKQGRYLLHFPEEEFKRLLQLLESLRQEGEHPNAVGQADATRALMILLVTGLIRRSHVAEQRLKNTQEEMIQQIISYINAHLAESITLEALSDRFFLSKYHLIREFKQYTNTTVYDYILSKRIVTAKELIRQGESMKDACFHCGFSDYSSFYRTFQKKVGLSPKAFKAICGAGV